MANEHEPDPISALLSEFGTRLNEVEEKQRLVKDRILLIGENLVSTKEEFEKQTIEFKKQISEISSELKTIRQLNKRIIEEMENHAQKSELQTLARQMKMFEPIEYARIKDIRNIIKEELLKINKDINNKK
ncbi:MAG: hypothetical protein Q8N99_05570 [Nanoarchaeota archaeon]|nr:hypothetical protein [Nanoarchaeota archaeon]